MEPASTFRPIFTVPNYHQKLSAARPIQVYTYDFRANNAGAEAPRLCGTVQTLAGVGHLQPHDHEHHEVALIVAGTALHRTANNARMIARGSVLTASPSDTHAFEHIDGLCMINCTYLTEYLFYDVREIFSVPNLAPLFFREAVFGTGLRMALPQWQLSEGAMAACLRELDDIAAERGRDDASPVFMRRTLEKLMLLLCRSFRESGDDLHMPSDPDVRAVLERIEEMVLTGTRFDACTLADEMGLSRDHLARRFRHAMGRNPTDYYQHRRVQQACCLLLDHNRTATDVAHELGYYDAAHFSRLFKRYRGITPKAFRARYIEA